jgi:hypothetical protein
VHVAQPLGHATHKSVVVFPKNPAPQLVTHWFEELRNLPVLQLKQLEVVPPLQV